MAKKETLGLEFREPKKLLETLRKQKYANFLDIWYENHKIRPKVKELLRNFETSDGSIFKKH